MNSPNHDSRGQLLVLTASVVSAYVGRNPVSQDQITTVIQTVYDALENAGVEKTPAAVQQEPAVPVRKSITPDYLVCLEDGKKLKILKRYLRTVYGMTPADYRAKWGLPADYPMVAPNYAAQRSEMAKQIGLGKSNARTSYSNRRAA